MSARTLPRILTVPRRFIDDRDRWVFAAIGMWAVVTGVLLALDSTDSQRVWCGRLWDALLLAGGLVTLAYVANPCSWRLRASSNALLVVGCAGRGAGFTLALGKLEGLIAGPAGTTSMPRAAVGITVWLMLALLLFVIWRSVLPWDRDGSARG